MQSALNTNDKPRIICFVYNTVNRVIGNQVTITTKNFEKMPVYTKPRCFLVVTMVVYTGRVFSWATNIIILVSYCFVRLYPSRNDNMIITKLFVYIRYNSQLFNFTNHSLISKLSKWFLLLMLPLIGACSDQCVVLEL